MNKNVLSILDVKDEIHDIIDLAIKLKNDYKKGKDIRYLKGKKLAMIFERTSIRTRVSFEFGIQMLGGIAISLTKEDIGIGTRETVEDIALVMSRYADIVMYRALDKKDLHDFAKYATIPVINGLDIDEHPTQILADLTTIKEKKHKLEGLKFVFVGDGDDNLTHTYMLACTLVGMDVTVISPKSHWPSKYFLDKATEIAKQKKVKLLITEDLEEIKNADVVATDTWVSIWYKDQKEQILKDLRGYTVTKELMSKAKPDAIFIHCMPIFYGEEVTKEVAHGPQSVIIDEAENRMWAEMALMVKILG
ncbi:MAG: ornithine carbamoyltransferase [Candidatus Thermoplasmatota archaeon]|jgi:ornithine carbamoyltransferase|nr:ornithine carbamoyltransferase [Candidatus Thermoplasmatota archaeon]